MQRGGGRTGSVTLPCTRVCKPPPRVYTPSPALPAALITRRWLIGRSARPSARPSPLPSPPRSPPPPPAPPGPTERKQPPATRDRGRIPPRRRRFDVAAPGTTPPTHRDPPPRPPLPPPLPEPLPAPTPVRGHMPPPRCAERPVGCQSTLWRVPIAPPSPYGGSL